MRIKSCGEILDSLNIRGYLSFVPDKMWIKYKYKRKFGKKLNLKNPKTFNEKLQWMKLYYRNPVCTTIVDKYEAKRYVAERIGEEYIIPTLGVWDRFEDIDFDALPNQFVLKCTHDSGGLVVCRDKRELDIEQAKHKINKCLKRNFYWHGREWVYKDIKPRIIAEKYMEDSQTKELRDYKFFCFNGEPKVLFVASGRQGSGEMCFDFFDTQYNHLPIRKGHPNAEEKPSKPVSFELMKTLAEKLSEDLPHVRADFYEVNGKVYFGELTFASGGGFGPFEPEEWDKIMGDWFILPKKQIKK